MDDVVIRSMLKWPDVPDVFGWLRLDRRGNWRVREASEGREPAFGMVGNQALKAFISRNYACDERGRWFFQNGPQRVFVQLAYAPFVFRIDRGAVTDHCGREVGRIDGVWVDEEGSLLLAAPGRVGLLDDRDLPAVADEVAAGVLRLVPGRFQVGNLAGGEIERRFGFVRDPGT